ncbi:MULTISPECIES: 16S rRNA (guanine(1207)-N(2))-methyltransferase RsmC [unclassified Gilliamella]|uniref:16S rRNA (guanine(1207)-N(2))-methyltransferase RsmC n=1 Tax=unclassified Gilliamella TaxID=2685620 RepID=UPI001C69CD17|nr:MULTISPECIES: 16S rRNA (guanine(1207)-N(2))-methyltransferase RsmC [unclassified Gilliamella]MCX8600740.1 16S rRNA (guanine(1207)-N(2))-methyltransferase RsmC [Gilliamella sp. B3722]MCX8608105.1 16S rRNA (guanine(1207)-N(2))-methyltransferase RsmC [Gilliamella sp. B3771]MCX8609960.1 16S rRNA (guanine(1207)-N(2))-methyltransferase RsmC [Gilliamella sp. B3891]MCX8611950.1 16S rRNA (guanine(1207)-N(2))-methyltransferase RsmC [Gilliamella sp. B3773]MCX8615310.1 16S rRNA (guanine(1207)-N(2))-met
MATSAYTPASQVIERHQTFFNDKNVIIAGDIQDSYPTVLSAKQVKIHCTQFHTYLRLKNSHRAQISFSLLPEAEFYVGMDTLIYYWPKTKSEAQFQLSYLLHNMPKGSDIFIVGENRTGVKSVEALLADFGTIQKIDSARRCGLYHFQAESRLAFELSQWWLTYHLTIDNHDIEVKSLPGVFSQKGLDAGSELLLNALLDRQDIVKGQVLDVGCGSGILSTVIGKLNPDVDLTLSDVSSAALASSNATLAANQLKGTVVASDVFSNLTDKYHLIISNPPFHDGKETSYTAVNTLIKEAKKHLKLNGYLCIVANSFLPYQAILDETFKSVELIAQTTKFKVYLASH